MFTDKATAVELETFIQALIQNNSDRYEDLIGILTRLYQAMTTFNYPNLSNIPPKDWTPLSNIPLMSLIAHMNKKANEIGFPPPSFDQTNKEAATVTFDMIQELIENIRATRKHRHGLPLNKIFDDLNFLLGNDLYAYEYDTPSKKLIDLYHLGVNQLALEKNSDSPQPLPIIPTAVQDLVVPIQASVDVNPNTNLIEEGIKQNLIEDKETHYRVLALVLNREEHAFSFTNIEYIDLLHTEETGEIESLICLAQIIREGRIGALFYIDLPREIEIESLQPAPNLAKGSYRHNLQRLTFKKPENLKNGIIDGFACRFCRETGELITRQIENPKHTLVDWHRFSFDFKQQLTSILTILKLVSQVKEATSILQISERESFYTKLAFQIITYMENIVNRNPQLRITYPSNVNHGTLALGHNREIQLPEKPEEILTLLKICMNKLPNSPDLIARLQNLLLSLQPQYPSIEEELNAFFGTINTILTGSLRDWFENELTRENSIEIPLCNHLSKTTTIITMKRNHTIKDLINTYIALNSQYEGKRFDDFRVICGGTQCKLSTTLSESLCSGQTSLTIIPKVVSPYAQQQRFIRPHIPIDQKQKNITSDFPRHPSI